MEIDSREKCTMKEQGYAEMILRFLRTVILVDSILAGLQPMAAL